MKRLRRLLIELWGIAMFAGVLGFLGPFGTYQLGDFLQRSGQWLSMLLGAYVVVRPAMILFSWIAFSTGLPRRSLVFWGVVVTAFGVAGVWAVTVPAAVQLLHGFSGLLPFSLLCSLGIMIVVGWAERADANLFLYYQDNRGSRVVDRPSLASVSTPAVAVKASQPRLHGRLTPAFHGAILALESEDHYVRVHGAQNSELILLRLRDAIAEMDQVPGEQTHRSWWVAQAAVAAVDSAGRNREIRLVNGGKVPVARDSVERLQAAGFLG